MHRQNTTKEQDNKLRRKTANVRVSNFVMSKIRFGMIVLPQDIVILHL